MYHAVYNIITAACRTNGYPERDVRRATQGSVEEANSGPASSFTDCYGTGTDECLTDANHSGTRSGVYLASLISKRKYEDMTSNRSNEPEIDHESTGKLSFFRENKRRKPPEAGNLVLRHFQVKVQDQGEDECQGSKRGSSPRSGSSRVLITPEVCGESDLTAENLMAEESSRSSNNDGSSKLESAAESVPKGTSRKPRSGSSVGVLHSFLDQPEGKREVPFSETLTAYQRSLGRNDGHTSSLSRQMEGMNESEGVAKLEPTSFRPVAPGSSGEPQAGVHSTSHPENEKWLQLGVGPSRNTASSSRLDPALEYRRESPPFQQLQGNVERPYGKRKTPSLDFQISEGREPNSFGQTPTMAASVQWQAQRGSMLHKVEAAIDSPATLNPHTFVSLPKSSLPRTSVAPEIGLNYNLEKDLCLFGSIVTAPSAQAVLAHTCASTGELPVIAPERHLETMSNLLSAPIDTRQQADPPGSVNSIENENLLLGGVGKPGIFNRALPPFASRSGDEVQFRSPQRATDHSVQFQRESRPTSLGALMQTADDQRQAAGHSWLSASDSAYKLIPVAKNFHGWSSEMNTSTRAGTGSDQVITERYPNQMDPQFQRASDEWGSLFRKVSSSMLFPSQLPLPDGSSRILNLDKSATAVSHEGQEPLKRAIKIQNRPQTQWTTIEPPNLGSVASWCLNGGKALPGTRAEKLEGEDRPGLSSILPERPSVQCRYPDSEQSLRPKQASQRQSWQPAAAGQPKLEQGNVTLPRASRSAAPIISKPGFQVLPSRGTSQAGLWFTLQSEAENQNEESGLPQINKPYLRVKDGKMPISAVKKYLVSKLGLGSEAEVEITCRGQPVVPNLPLQHVRDEIWYSTLNPSKDQTTTTSGSGDKDDSTSADQRVRSATICNPAMFSKDVVMVLTYRRHARSMPPQHC